MNATSIAIAIALVSLSGCASMMGNATYNYSHTTKDGTTCVVSVDSGRSVKGGAEAQIDKDCKLTVKAANLEQGQAGLKVSDIATLIQLLGPAKAPQK